ncbi:PPPDE putative peptidase domain-containing protein [Pilaira anomala]|nr:PPPDE putative peptidase domain-containing protein [Pilaira anomala]
MAESVKLYVYDLSQGMARSMSLSLTGKQIDGIWHTSVVVYGQEFYYGQGIMASAPGTTHHGRPLEIIDIGETYLPLEVVIEYIDSLRSVYTAEKYHLLDFNCNTFSNDLCQFLCGKTIPSHITGLPSEFLNTPFGQSLLPMIEGMFGQSQLRSNGTAVAPPVSAQTSAQAASLLQGVSSAAMSAAPTTVQPVQFVNDSTIMEKFFTQYKAVAVMFTSATCPPCKVIKPEFIKMIENKHQGQETIKLLGIVMDTGSPAFNSQKYGIRGVPTFQFYLNGKKTGEFSGANYAELKSQVDMLLFDAFPPHPHRKILLRTIVDQPNVPITYNVPGKLEMIYGKLNSFFEQEGIVLDVNQKKALDGSKNFLENPTTTTIEVASWKLLVDELLKKLSKDQLFPLLDIYKSLIVHKQVSDYYVTYPLQISNILEIVNSQEPPKKATWLMILRIACNIFANSTLSTTHFTSKLETSHRSQLTQLLITSLLADDAQIRQAAASLAYNCSTCIAIERLKKEEGMFTGMAEQEDDDWLVELSSAILDALTKETDEEILHRLLAAVGKFLFLSPADSSVANLLSALDIDGILDAKKKEKVIVSSKILGLARDVSELVKLSLQE